MSTPCEHESIVEAFGSRLGHRRSQATRAAYADPHADELLAQLLDACTDRALDGPNIAAHLGDFTGDAGDAALRRAIRASGPGTRDLRCAALLALARRVGPSATTDLVIGLESSDSGVKDFAVFGLAGAGDSSACWQVLDYLRAAMRRKRRALGQSEVAMALAYLAQHAVEPAFRSELVTFIRRHWTVIDDAQWFAELWPEAAPTGPAVDAVPLPDGAAVRTWARQALFTHLGPPTV